MRGPLRAIGSRTTWTKISCPTCNNAPIGRFGRCTGGAPRSGPSCGGQQAHALESQIDKSAVQLGRDLGDPAAVDIARERATAGALDLELAEAAVAHQRGALLLSRHVQKERVGHRSVGQQAAQDRAWRHVIAFA
jgi:predicted RNA-binding Zn-ribbon protein involved in translation (DUF1610 family)